MLGMTVHLVLHPVGGRKLHRAYEIEDRDPRPVRRVERRIN